MPSDYTGRQRSAPPPRQNLGEAMPSDYAGRQRSAPPPRQNLPPGEAMPAGYTSSREQRAATVAKERAATRAREEAAMPREQVRVRREAQRGFECGPAGDDIDGA